MVGIGAGRAPMGEEVDPLLPVSWDAGIGAADEQVPTAAAANSTGEFAADLPAVTAAVAAPAAAVAA